MLRVRPSRPIVGVAVVSFALHGCASSGPRPATGPSSPDKRAVTLPGWQIESVEPGRRLVLTLRDGTLLQGTYRGLRDVPEDQYATRYAKARQQGGLVLPRLGPGLRVTGVSGDELTRDFLGVEARSLRFKDASVRGTSHMLFSLVKQIADAEGQSIEGSRLEQLVGAGSVPVLTELVLDTRQGKQHVSFERVAQVEVGSKTGGGAKKTIGIILGVAAVVAIVVAATSGSPKPAPSPTPPCSPLVSSYDGKQYIPDSDAFGGAMFKAAKRTDWDTLEHMGEVGGEYRVKIQKGQAETEFVDELALLAVDHPPHTRVVPDFGGALHILGNPQAPIRAVAARGGDVTALVARPDDRIWVSSPFGRDPDDRSQVRDGMTLEFARPAGARSATLVFRVQNTLWGYHVRQRFLELLGTDFEAWYARMDTASGDYQAFDRARRREVALGVQVGEGRGWRDAGFVWEVGPSLPRDVAVVLDLHDVAGERLRVRLDSTVGLWTIDSVQIHYSEGALREVREIAPSRATDQASRDIAPSLSRADGLEHVMTEDTDWAEATFPAPPRRPGWERSLVLKTTGYYRIHVSGRGEPQWALVQRMVEEPGAFGQHTLRLLSEYERALFEQIGSGE